MNGPVRRGVCAVAVALVAVVMSTAATASSAHAADADQESAVRDYAVEYAVPAMVAGVVGPDGRVTVVPHGTTSDGVPATADTRFRIASMSKAFTAVAVQRLAEQGRLRLDQPVAEIVPGFGVDDPRGDTITVRHLLSHTSGISNADLDEFALPPPASSAAMVARLRDVPLAAPPGTVHQYLNANYDTAARAVEIVTGRPFGEYLRDEVLLPLGMTSTVATDRCDDVVPGLPLGHIGALGIQVPVPEIPSWCGGDGGVVTTATDMTRWLRFQLGDTPGPVSPASLTESHTAMPGTDGRYGLGWSVRTGDDGRTRVLHGGEIATWTSGIELSGNGSGAFVLTDARGVPGQLAERLTTIADGRGPGTPSSDPMWIVNIVLVGLAALAAALLATTVVRARRWADAGDGRRRVVSLPVVAVLLGVVLLPAAWAFVTGTSSATAWLMVFWMLPTAGLLAIVLVAGGVAALVARRAALRSRREPAVVG